MFATIITIITTKYKIYYNLIMFSFLLRRTGNTVYQWYSFPGYHRFSGLKKTFKIRATSYEEALEKVKSDHPDYEFTS